MTEDTTTPEIVAPKPKATKRKKNKRTVAYGHMHIQATFNNTIVSFTDTTGAVLTQVSAGACGFRGSKKVQPMLLKLQQKKQEHLQNSSME
jgi:small subunit ribosomal protein S11